MEFRSTENNYVHFQGDVVSNVNSSHGVHLTGGSTGGVVQPASDDAAAALHVRAKGATGILNLGTSTGGPVVFNGSSLNLGSTHVSITSTRVSFSSGAVVQIGSTAPFAGFVRQISTAIATPDFNSTDAMGVISTVTMTGVNSSHFILANPINLSSAVHITRAWVGSTDNSVNLHWLKHSTVTIAASTATVRLLAVRF